MAWWNSMTEDEKPTTTKPTPTGPHFIPKLKDKKVTIRLVSGGQPITGTIEAYNPYELLLKTTKGELVVFKHSIATIEKTTK
jgi:RNA chaperone Hfq